MDEYKDAGVVVAHWAGTAEQGMLEAVRRELPAFAAGHGMSPAACADLAEAVGEALANAACHAYPEPGPAPILVDAATDGESFSVRVVDHGTGAIRDDAEPGGGIRLMTVLSERLELSGVPGEGTSVLMEFPMTRPIAAARAPRASGGTAASCRARCG